MAKKLRLTSARLHELTEALAPLVNRELVSAGTCRLALEKNTLWGDAGLYDIYWDGGCGHAGLSAVLIAIAECEVVPE